MANNWSPMDSQQTSPSQSSTTDDMASPTTNYIHPGATQNNIHIAPGATNHNYNGCYVTHGLPIAAAAAVPTASPNEPSSQPAEEEDCEPPEFEDMTKWVFLPQSMFLTFSKSSGKKKNQPTKAQLEIAGRCFIYYQFLDRKQISSSCPVHKNSESIRQFACLLLSLVEGLEKLAEQTSSTATLAPWATCSTATLAPWACATFWSGISFSSNGSRSYYESV